MMRNILILGAGKSSIALIDYLVGQAAEQQWQITVADVTAELAVQKTKKRAHTQALGFDLNNDTERKALIAKADIVISMLPAALHITVAKDCLTLKKNLVTPSYISDAMQAMAKDVEDAGLIFMNEMGLDPGIDHMSAMQLIDELKAQGATITGFASHCGGLVAPESDDNPWHYKFTWNPRNVILAGQGAGGIHYLHDGKEVELNYKDLFHSTSLLEIEDYGLFESYPNRDSLKYIDVYGLRGVDTMYRGTLRIPPFSKGWDMLVRMGMTSEEETSTNDLLEHIIAELKHIATASNTVKDELLQSIGLVNALQSHRDETIVPAKFLQSLLEEQWKMLPGDKDMVVMVHEIDYVLAGEKKQVQSSFVYIGKDAEHTAMAITVGLPVGIITKMILNGEVQRKGVLMPKYAEIYTPVLEELKGYGIVFKEKMIQ